MISLRDVSGKRFCRRLTRGLILGLAMGLAAEAMQMIKDSREVHAKARIWISKGWSRLDDASARFAPTVIETIESEEMARRASARVQVLHDGLRPVEVWVEALAEEQVRRGDMFVVTARGTSAEYVPTFLNALLDEMWSFGREVHERHLSTTRRALVQQKHALEALDNQILQARQEKPADGVIAAELERQRRQAREQYDRESSLQYLKEEGHPMVVVDRARLVTVRDRSHAGAIAAAICAALLAGLAGIQRSNPAALTQIVG